MSRLLHEQHHRAVEHLVHEWARAIDENRVEAIAELMLPGGRYTVQSRFNADRGLPLALIDAHSAAQLRDRIKAMRLANIYEPQHYRHMVSGVQIVGSAPAGSDVDGQAAEGADLPPPPLHLQVRSNFLIVRTMERDGEMALYAAGQCQDVVDVSGAAPLFVRRHVLLDSRAVETLMVIPL
jgi:anthranilate 1,2-dioxygenase small subunit